MENLPNNYYQTKIPLNESESYNSKILEKQCLLTFSKEDDNNFQIDAVVENKEFFLNLTMSDLLNMKEKNFTHKIHNFKLLLKAIKKGIKKKKVTVSQLNESLKLTLFYTIVYDKEKISFELNPKPSEENKTELIKKEEEKENEDYKVELIEYSKDMEDYIDRNIVRAIVENKGRCSWPKGKSSFTCLPEFSSLICQECILEDDVMPGEQIEIYLEFLKSEKQCSEKKFFSSLNLNICQERFGPIFLLNFNNPFKQENANENIDENEKDSESKEIIVSSEDNEDNEETKISSISLKKEGNIVNKEEIKKEEKKEKEDKEDKEDKEEKGKKDVKEKIEVKEKENVGIKENEKKKENVKKEEKKDVKKEKKEDLNEEEIEKMPLVQRRVYELNKKEKERIENEKEQKMQKFGKKV